MKNKINNKIEFILTGKREKTEITKTKINSN